MNLEELKKNPSQMTKEELEAYMLSIIERMNSVLDGADIRIDEEKNARRDRKENIRAL